MEAVPRIAEALIDRRMSNPFQDSALTTILVVSDMEKAKHFYLDVLGASLFREYGGDSMVIEFLGNWLLICTEGGPRMTNPTPISSLLAIPIV